MHIRIGTRIGAFEIREPLGAGGMGEVYRARDTRLGRDVAIKILPHSFACDAVRRARFDREARVLASLSHPNVATLYGVEDSPAGQVLVLELVEGQTLSDRLVFGPLPLAEVMAIARQVATALEAAHDRGIVHRDLKPSNIAVRPDGMVKVLDFGLARALGEGTESQGAAPATTITDVGDGMGPGTPAYMSPEQARGLPTDKRTDVWAFGCVLYEALTGRRAFEGDRTTDVVARILERETDLSLLPRDTPEAIRRLLRRCLEKDPQNRQRDIGDARLDLQDAAAARPGTMPSLDWNSTPLPRLRRMWPAAAAVATLALGAIAVPALLGGEAPVETERPGARLGRLTFALPPGVTVTRGPGVASSVAISPDGRTIVVAGSDATGQRLYVRPFDRLEATPLAGTERGSSPFFSWDGAWVGFAADGWLKRIPRTGGAAVNIVKLSGFPAGASWGPDDRIVFTYGADTPLHTVGLNARGEQAEVLTPGQRAYRPEVLPDGSTVLYESNGWVFVLDRVTGRKTRLVEGTAPRFADGHLVVARDTTLLAAAFDPTRHELIGSPLPLLESAVEESGTIGGMVHFAVSRNGTLAYLQASERYSLVVVHADGTERLLASDHYRFSNPRFSPDGNHVLVAVRRHPNERSDLWMHDVRTGAATRLTFDGASRPLWGPGEHTITYSRPSSPNSGIYTMPAGGSNDARPLLGLDGIHWIVGWTPDRRTLVYGAMEGTPSSIMALTGTHSRRVVGPGSVWGGRLSHDGRWLVYYSLDSGTFEVFVAAFPGGSPRWPIAEGTDPAWSRDGREIYYRNGTRLMAARIDTSGGVVRAVSHRVALEPFVPPAYDDYDIHPDRRTLVVVRPANSVQLREVSITLHWPEQLKTLSAAEP